MKGTKEGLGLTDLIAIAKPILKQVDRGRSRIGPGRKPEIPDWVMGLLIMTATLKMKKSKSAQFRWISHHQGLLQPHLDGYRIPSRSTYFDRFRKVSEFLNQAIVLMGRKAIQRGWADASVVAADKSLLRAKGPIWWKSDRQKNRIPNKLHGVDRDSHWGFSSHHGWVQGYAFEVVISCGKNGLMWPLIASADPANVSEHKSFEAKILLIPKRTRFVLADAGYDNNQFADQFETPSNGGTRKRFLCPQNRRAAIDEHIAPKGINESRRKYAARMRRAERRDYFQTPAAQKHYKLRSVSVEPFNEWFKHTFELNDRVWHRGLDNNRTQVLAAMFAYQTLLYYKCKMKSRNGQIKTLIDAL